MSYVVDLVQEIVDQLNAGSFSQSFTAERKYYVDPDLSEIETLQVTAAVSRQEITTYARAYEQFNITVDVAIQNKAGDDATRDTMVDFAEEIIDFLRGKNMTPGAETFDWLRIENEPVYFPDHFREYGVFTTLIRCTYQITRGR